MSMLTKALAILLLVLLVACIALGLTAIHRGDRIDTLNALLTANAQTVQDLTGANASQNDTIKELQGRLDAAAGHAQNVEQAANEAQATAAANAQARDAALAEIQRLRGETYARDADASAWAGGHLPAVLTDGLREQWNQARAGGSRHEGD